MTTVKRITAVLVVLLVVAYVFGQAAGYPASSLSGQIDLTTQVVNVLPVANGGTGASSLGCITGCSFVVGVETVNGINVGNSAVTTANQIHLMRFLNANNKLLGTKACIDVVNTDNGKHADVGVFSLSSGNLTLQWHTGSLLTTTAGQVCATGLSTFTMLPGTAYYIGYCSDSVTTASVGNVAPGVGAGATVNSTLAGGPGSPANIFGVDSTDSCTAGVLPAGAGAIAVSHITNSPTNVQVPMVIVFN